MEEDAIHKPTRQQQAGLFLIHKSAREKQGARKEQEGNGYLKPHMT